LPKPRLPSQRRKAASTRLSSSNADQVDVDTDGIGDECDDELPSSDSGCCDAKGASNSGLLVFAVGLLLLRRRRRRR